MGYTWRRRRHLPCSNNAVRATFDSDPRRPLRIAFRTVLIGLKRPHRIEMIPMRDGVKPYTVIILPRGAKDAPIVLTRAPNNARRPVSNTDPSMEALLPEADTEFVRVRIRNTRPK